MFKQSTQFPILRGPHLIGFEYLNSQTGYVIASIKM